MTDLELVKELVEKMLKMHPNDPGLTRILEFIKSLE